MTALDAKCASWTRGFGRDEFAVIVDCGHNDGPHPRDRGKQAIPTAKLRRLQRDVHCREWISSDHLVEDMVRSRVVPARKADALWVRPLIKLPSQLHKTIGIQRHPARSAHSRSPERYTGKPETVHEKIQEHERIICRRPPVQPIVCQIQVNNHLL
jgi:hypothetical protein